MASPSSSSEPVIVLITGATSGIGLELATQLLSIPSPVYHVLLGARSPSKADKVLSSLRALNLPGSASILPLDLTSDTSIRAAAASISKDYGRLDILVNNAGVCPLLPSDPLAPVDGNPEGESFLRERMRASFETNAIGPVVLAFATVGLLEKARGGGRIVNVSSGAGSMGLYGGEKLQRYKSNIVHYQVSKAALNMGSVWMRKEWAEKGIKVSVFCPGFTESGLSDGTKVGNGAKKVEDSVRPLVEVVQGKRDGEEGIVVEGGRYPW